MKTPQEYIESLRGQTLEVYYMGERIDDIGRSSRLPPAHQRGVAHLRPSSAHERRRGATDLMQATSHLTGETINRFTHIHQSTDDLVKKVKMLRAHRPADRHLLPALRRASTP